MKVVYKKNNEVFTCTIGYYGLTNDLLNKHVTNTQKKNGLNLSHVET